MRLNWRKQNKIYSNTIYVDVHEMVDCQKAWEINRGLKHQKTTGKGFVKMGIVYYFGSIVIYHGTGEVLVNGCEWEVLFIMDVRQDIHGLMVINDLPL